MEAHFELFDLTEDKEKLWWFVSRMTNPVKLIWAKIADKQFLWKKDFRILCQVYPRKALWSKNNRLF